MSRVRLAVVSTSRSDLGAQEPVHAAARGDERFETTLVLSGHHHEEGGPRPPDAVLSPRGEATISGIDQRALATLLQERRVEIVLVNGDRYELLDVAIACSVAGVGLAHAAGGERTLGAIDDAIRDAVTKLAHLHYPVHDQAAERLRALQERDDRICVAGEPAIDGLFREPPADPAELAAEIGAEPRRGDVVVAVHPVTRFPDETARVVDAVAATCAAEPSRTFFLSTPNRDPGAEPIERAWASLASHRNVRRLASLGHRRFRSLVRACGMLVGNSSAGLYEAPSLGALTIDIGRRQLGRVRGPSVTTVEPSAEAVRQAIADARADSFANPYGDGSACARLLDHLWRNARRSDLLVKP